jgi:hypothetical protein
MFGMFQSNVNPLTKDTKEVSSVLKTVPASEQEKSNAKAAKALISRSLGSGRKWGKKFSHRELNYRSMNINVVNVIDCLTNSSGALFFLTSGAVLAASTDFAAADNLFDIMRCKAVTCIYSPIGAGQTPVASTSGIHVPMVYAGDPEATSAPTFATVIGTKDFSEKVNQLTNSGINSRHSYKFVRAGLNYSVSAGAAEPVLGDWVQTTSAAVTACGGGVEVAFHTLAANNAVTLGTMQIVYHCEFASRV